ncbi:MAG: adenine deaminase [Prevotellaceae bacterium]|jgi:adenine deaminase|nr:adenine deaminase [Prevotellaceae bacterium]
MAGIGASESMRLSGYIADVESGMFFQGKISIKGGKIEKIERCEVENPQYILPGLVDSHVHIESSMLTPSEFARVAVRNGVVAVVADPHEIANVMGVEGVRFMMDNADQAKLKFYWGVPSCVPAAPFDISGAILGASEVGELLSDPRATHLGEMMNFPGVVSNDPEVLAKIEKAKQLDKPVDGHAPGLAGEDLKKYVASGISTDHEAIDICEAEEKLHLGMKILIREGSAAKNFENLYPLVNQYPSQVMFCTDDCHPDDLLKGTINLLVKRGVKKGLDFFNLIKAASINPVKHYNLGVGQLRVGEPADFIVVDNPDDFNIRQTYINGEQVYSSEEDIVLPTVKVNPINNFKAKQINTKSLEVVAKGGKKIRVMEVIDKEIYTKLLEVELTVADGKVVPDLDKDILKIVVVNRYEPTLPVVGFVKGTGITYGAICSSVAHDSHNIIAIGADDSSLVEVINEIIEAKGGIGVHNGKATEIFPLPIAGIMSTEIAEAAAAAYEYLQEKAKRLGTTLTAPFMIMAFLALIVIPELKIAAGGLFDVTKFQPVDLFV